VLETNVERKNDLKLCLEAFVLLHVHEKRLFKMLEVFRGPNTFMPY
jgi:hypothetical protein